MIGAFARRMLTEVDLRLLWKFCFNFGLKGAYAVQRFEKRGRRFPAFVFFSVTNRCNLRCQGCWVTTTNPPLELSSATMDKVIRAAKRQGSYFFGILGGEPFLHAGVFDLIRGHPDCYFQIFTNGTLITDEAATVMRRLGNVTPLISIEGDAQVSDERRGGQDVYRRSLEGLARCRRERLVIGVATSVCQSNFGHAVSDQFIDEFIRRGAHYIWYYIYRPAGGNPAPGLALTTEQILELRRFLVDRRTKAPVMLIDAYWDHEGKALCPAAVGISHVVNPGGDIEPCPVVQFARDNLNGQEDPVGVFTRSEFLAGFRDLAARTSRGCILLEHPDTLLQFMQREHARDTSGRGTGLQELAAMTQRPSHHVPGQEIPERQWMYRFAKKHWFFGFGAYG